MSDQLLSTKAKFEVVWAELKRLCIPEVVITFSGEGDSGQIDDVQLGNTPIPGVPDTGPEWARLNEALTKTYVDLGQPNASISLVHLIEELTDPLTTNHGADWWNGDGGFGECTWYVNDEPPRIELSISERIVHTEEYSFELDKYGEETE